MSTFLQACGLAGPLVIQVEDIRTREIVRHVFRQPFLVAGRDPHTDLPLEDESVSQRHAYFQGIGGQVFCVDLRSRTGLLWNQGRERSGWLASGQAVGIGPFLVSVAESVQHDSPLASATEPAPLMELVLEVLEGDHVRERKRISQVLALVGRTRECAIQVRGKVVSKLCCSLLRTPQGVWMVDLLGRPSTLVNGQPMRWARLEENDHLEIGPLSFRVRIPAPGNSVPGTDLVPWGKGTLVPGPPYAGALAAPLAVGSPERDALAALLLPLLDHFGRMQQQISEEFTQTLLMMHDVLGDLRRDELIQRDQVALVREELQRLERITQDLQALEGQLAATAAPPRPPRQEPVSEPPPPEKGTGTAPTAGAPAPPAPVVPSEEAAAMHARLSQQLLRLREERESHWQKILNFLGGK
jgi:pSer/pThr/pTyr-binding forkhead associated (FHA) protein